MPPPRRTPEIPREGPALENDINGFIRQKSFAVAGSFRDESKFAYKILNLLISMGKEVYPVNPSLKEVQGRICYGSVKDIPCDVDAASLVTPPEASEKIVRECLEKNIKKVWFQPGAESDAAVEFCRENGMDIIHGLCVILEGLKSAQRG